MGKWGDAFGIMRDILYGKAQYLDLYEQATLAFIYGRTRYYGKEWEHISIRDFMSGIWSRDSQCITPRIRISEASLLRALKGLEEKTIIEVRRRPSRSNWYRIRPETEFDFDKALYYILSSQVSLLRMMVGEMEDNLARLSEGDLRRLEDFKQVIGMHEAGELPISSRTQEVSAPSDVGESTTSATSQVRVHKIPILLNNKLPIVAPASPKGRRKKLVIRPLSSLNRNRSTF